MKQRFLHNNEQLYYARIRSHHYGESQSFTSSDATIQWVEQTSRELVASGYTNVTFTIQGEYNRNNCKRQATSTLHDNRIQSVQSTSEPLINNKKQKENMQDPIINPTTDFFSLSESEVRTIAAATMDAATRNKEVNDRAFIDAIADASNGLVTINKSAKNADRVDFRGWDAYTATHAPRDPGKKPLNAIEQTIIDTYQRGRSGTSDKVDSAASDRSQNTNNALTSIYLDNTPAAELLNSIVSAILVRIYQNDYVKHYLRYNRCSLDEELSIQTGGIITCSISSNSITLGSIAGITSSIATENRSLIDIDTEVRAILIRMLIQAALSAKTRDAVARIINLEELGDMVYRL